MPATSRRRRGAQHLLLVLAMVWSLAMLHQGFVISLGNTNEDEKQGLSTLQSTIEKKMDGWSLRRSSQTTRTAWSDRATRVSAPSATTTTTSVNPLGGNSKTQLDRICSIPPGYGLEEGGLMGYQVLLRMRHVLPKPPKRTSTTDQPHSLLCVWFAIQDNDDDEQQLGVYEQARSIYASTGCNGTLQVNVTTTVEASTSALPEVTSVVDENNHTFHSITISSLSTIELQKVFRYIASLMKSSESSSSHASATSSQYTWFHWTDPHGYFFMPSHLNWRLQEIQPNNAQRPTFLQTWNLMDMEHTVKYHQLYGEPPSPPEDCQAPQSGNEPLARRLAACQQQPVAVVGEASSSNRTLHFQQLQGWMASCLLGGGDSNSDLVCHIPTPRRDRHTAWLFLHRHVEIQLPPVPWRNNNENGDSLLRLDAILRGRCDPIWDKPLGALDEHGRPGYIHDPTRVKRNPPAFTYFVKGEEKGVCEIPFGEGDEGENGYQGLRKIKIATSHQTEKRVLCLVYTHSENHFFVQSIAETWGPRCDGFLAASNMTDPSIGAVHLLHEGPEEYDNMWLKIRAMFQYVYDHYLDDYDYVHIGGDDHYLIPENLRYTVSVGSWKGAWDDTQPLFLGGSLPLKGTKRRYCNGGSGYTLNRAALRLLVEELFPTPRCMPHWQVSREDQMVAACFRSVGIQCMDTNDHRNETRYHTWNADQHTAWKIGIPAQGWTKLRDYHGIAWKEGLGQISESSVSFHLKNPDANTTIDSGMRRYDAILYGRCKDNKSIQQN